MADMVKYKIYRVAIRNMSESGVEKLINICAVKIYIVKNEINLNIESINPSVCLNGIATLNLNSFV